MINEIEFSIVEVKSQKKIFTLLKLELETNFFLNEK